MPHVLIIAIIPAAMLTVLNISATKYIRIRVRNRDNYNWDQRQAGEHGGEGQEEAHSSSQLGRKEEDAEKTLSRWNVQP